MPHRSLPRTQLAAVDKSLSRVLLQVRTLRNSTLPVMRLPPDILEIIFSMLQDHFPLPSPIYAFYGIGSPERPYSISPKWLRVMHVCHYWRETALARSSLWTTVSLKRRADASLLQHYILRSSNRLLSVQINTRDIGDESPNAVRYLLDQLHRIRELNIYGTIYPEEHQLIESSPAPHLETLTMHAHLRPPDGILPCTRLPTIFQGETTAVKHFAAYLIHPFSYNHFGNLRQLHLVNQEYTFGEDYQRFLDAIDSNPHLEDIMLTRVAVDIPNTQITRGRRAHAHSLRRLCFQHMRGTDVGYILSTLDLSAEFTLQVLTDETQLFGDVTRSCDALHALKAVKLHIWNRTCDVSGVGSSFAWYIEMCASAGPEVAKTLGLELSAMMGAVEEVWVNDCLDQEDEENDIPPRYSAFFDCFFSVAPQLTTLVLQSVMWDEMGLLRSLVAEDQQVLCPNLSILEIHGIHAKLWEPLVDFLARRKALGFPVRTLNIFTSSMDSEDALRTFESWQELAPSQVAPLVETTNLVKVDRCPRLRLPAVCAPRSRGRWDWPSWKSIGDAEV